MKRRSFVQALTAIPAAAPLYSQQPAPQPVPAGRGGGRGAMAPDDTKLEIAVAEAAADPLPHFFTAAQFGALQRVSDILAPAGAASPGALAAQAPEFLDFLVGKSSADRQNLYRAGLDGLNAEAKKQFGRAFVDLDATQADTLMAPLRKPWTFDEPSDPVARFLRAAKADVRIATANARASAGNGRRMSGSGLYWYPLD